MTNTQRGPQPPRSVAYWIGYGLALLFMVGGIVCALVGFITILRWLVW